MSLVRTQNVSSVMAPNEQELMFVWLGNPITEDLRDKIKAQIAKGHKVNLLYDRGTVFPQKKADFERSLKAVQALGCELVELKMDKKDNVSSLLKKTGLNKKEIEILKRAYFFNIYGHDYYKDRNPEVNVMHQNWAAAADIARLIGLRSLQKKAAKKIKVVTYLDHDVTPTERMNQTMQTSFQLHRLIGKSAVAPTVPNPENEEIALNNDVLRVAREEEEFCKNSLKLIADRYQRFFELDPKMQGLMTYRHSVFKNLRLAATIYLAGPHIYETLAHQGMKMDEKNFLFDQGEYKDADPSEYDFYNEEARSWMKTYKYERETYKQGDPVAEREFMFKLGTILRVLMKPPLIEEVNMTDLDKNLTDIEKSVIAIGLPKDVSDPFSVIRSKEQRLLYSCGFQDADDYRRFRKSFKQMPSDHPVQMIFDMHENNPARLFQFLTAVEVAIDASENQDVKKASIYG